MRTRAYRAAESIRHSLRNGFTAYIVLSPVSRKLCCHRCPSEALASLERDASIRASGPHVFVVRIGAVRYRHPRVHRIPPHVRDDHDPPLLSGETVRFMPLICPTTEAEYFCFVGLTPFLIIRSDLPVGLICGGRAAKLCLRGRRRSSRFWCQSVPTDLDTVLFVVTIIQRRSRSIRHVFSMRKANDREKARFGQRLEES